MSLFNKEKKVLQHNVNKPNIRKPVIVGLVTIGLFFGSLLMWSLFFPLEIGAVAPGTIIVDTNNKTIQHLEGGIIKEIYVDNGALVQKGDKLLKLDDTQAQARVDLLENQINTLSAQESRLTAERDNEKQITFKKELIAQEKSGDPEVKEIVQSQIAIFNARKKFLNENLAILKQKVLQLNDEIASLQSQITSSKEQLQVLEEEIKAVRYLDEQNLIEKPRLWALLRARSRLEGERDKDLALISRAKQQIQETSLRMNQQKNDLQKEILETLQETQTNLADAKEQYKAALDILTRTLIISPRNGIVTALQFHTRGGVIGKGEDILNIIPSEDELVIEARVNPLDIDVVHPGLPTKVRISPLKVRNIPMLNGKVDKVSADIMSDERTGENYYLARIIIGPGELKRLDVGTTLYPGMPVDVLIIANHQPILYYLISPISDSFFKAFHE